MNLQKRQNSEEEIEKEKEDKKARIRI